MKVEHDAAAHRFRIPLEEGEAFLEYTEAGPRTLDFQHTVVPQPSRGEGIGETLVRHALDHARREGYRVVPSCPFVRQWASEHPEYRDVVES